jgi:hypothetical protein
VTNKVGNDGWTKTFIGGGGDRDSSHDERNGDGVRQQMMLGAVSEELTLMLIIILSYDITYVTCTFKRNCNMAHHILEVGDQEFETLRELKYLGSTLTEDNNISIESSNGKLR